MSKAIFRFLRGELNGYYITRINNVLNVLTQGIRSFFVDFNNMQLEQDRITKETLYNLGKFAGIVLPRIPRAEARSSIRMTESEYDEQLHYEFSERGLFNTQDEVFEFEQKVIDDTGLPDINTLATDTKRSSLVGTESVEGYIAQDEINVVDDDGNVRPEKIMPSPPENQAYSDFYGNEFLFLSEGETTYIPVSSAVFIELFKAMQYVRYNGSTLQALVRIINTICPNGLVLLDNIAVADSRTRIIIEYTTDLSVDIDLKQDRINILLYVVKMKFPQVQMSEIL